MRSRAMQRRGLALVVMLVAGASTFITAGATSALAATPTLATSIATVTGPTLAGGQNFFVFLNGVSCATGANCTEVGGVDNGSSSAGISAVQSGGNPGAAVAVPNPAGADTFSGDLDAVSCTTPSNCVAAGDFAKNGVPFTMTANQSSGTFSPAVQVAQPANAMGNTGIGGPSPGISCTSAGACTAVSSYTNSSQNATTNAMATNSSGSVFSTATQVAAPANVSTTMPSANLNAVSCTAVGTCNAAGSYSDNVSPPNTQSMVVTSSAGTFGTPQEIAAPSNLVATSFSAKSSILADISCPTAGNCTAVGQYTVAGDQTAAMVETESAGVFAPTAVQSALPSGASTTAQFAFWNGVSCWSAGNCLLVGTYIDASGNGQAMQAFETAGSMGTATQVTAPSDANVDPEGNLISASCSGADICTAVGSYQNNTPFNGGQFGGLQTAAMSYSIAPVVTMSTTTLASGTTGHAYSATLAASGGTGAYSYSVSSGTLPAGLSLNASTGVISGTPTAAGSPVVTFKVTDSGPPNQIATAAITLSIAAGVAPPPAGVSTAAFGTPVTSTVVAGAITTLTGTDSNGTATVSVPAGALPPGTIVSLYPVTNAASLTGEVPAGKGYLLGFAISWITPTGTSPNATSPITMTVTAPGILVGDTIYMATATGLVAVGTATVNGSVTVSFISDPTFIVTLTPKMTLASKHGKLVKNGDEIKVTCRTGIACHGSASLTVARKHKVGKRTVVSHVTLASSKISIPAGSSREIVFRFNKAGKAALAHAGKITYFRMTMVTKITGGLRVVAMTSTK